jgi:integrase
MKRRGNNEGSLRKTPYGTWQAQVLLEWRRLSKTFKARMEAQEWIRKTQNQIDTSEVGTPILFRNLLRDFQILLRKAGLPKIRFHDLRHTAASITLNHGISVIVVSRRLGHARPSITLVIYGHLIPSMQVKAAQMMDELITPLEINPVKQSPEPSVIVDSQL